MSFEASWGHPLFLLSFMKQEVESVGQRAELELEPKHPFGQAGNGVFS